MISFGLRTGWDLELLVPSSLEADLHLFFRFVGTELPKVAGAPAAPALTLSVFSSSVWEGAGSSTAP
jgi:hypothetical protein